MSIYFSHAILILVCLIAVCKFVIDIFFREVAFSEEISKKVFLFFSGLLLILFFGLRGNTGQDYIGYYSIFSYYNSLSFREILANATFRSETLFGIINWLCGRPFIDNPVYGYALLNFVVISICICCYFRVIYDYSEYPCISVILYVLSFGYIQMFNTMRSGLAYCILFLGVIYIQRGNLMKWIMLAVIATAIHFSSIVLVPVYFIRKYKLTKRNLFVFFLACFIVFVFFDELVDFFVFGLDFYSYYDGFYAFYGVSFSIGQLVEWSIIFFIGMCLILNYKYVRECIGPIWIWFFLFYALVFFLIYKLELITRYNSFFGLSIPIILTKVLKLKSIYHERVLIVYLIIACFFLLKMLSDSYGMDYEFFFD